jgi:hypothetical protein
MAKVGLFGAALLLLGAQATDAAAQANFNPPDQSTVWDVELGTAAVDLPDDFIEIHCGTNGGPPSIPLSDFTEFEKCKPGSAGLREVYFEYDDEAEYWARAYADEALIRRYRGTQVYDFPVVASVLLDEDGIVRGIRMVTDPRADYRDRNEFWTLANFLKQRFGVEGWSCEDLPHSEGEKPVGSYFVKDRCTKRVGDQYFVLERRYYQKKGQSFVNPHTGEVQPDYFESEARFEVYDATAVDLSKIELRPE